MASEIIDTDKFVYYVSMPKGVHEAVVPCNEGHTVYIDEDLSREEKLMAYAHALKHIEGEDFKKDDIQEIESNAHGKY